MTTARVPRFILINVENDGALELYRVHYLTAQRAYKPVPSPAVPHVLAVDDLRQQYIDHDVRGLAAFEDDHGSDAP